MRNTFSKKLYDMIKKDKDVVIVLADLGYTVFDDIEKEFPGRIINVGIAEQNMVGVAAGLAISGKKPLIYSIVPFVTFRCLEQIRVDLCYNELDVKIVGIGSGFSYGSCGPTHQAIEDLSIMKSLPNMKVMCPASSDEVALTMDYIFRNKGPAYISLTKNTAYGKFAPRKVSDYSYQILEGDEIAVLVNGSILSNVYEACIELKKEGISVAVYSLPFIKPFDVGAVKEILKKFNRILTIEEHNVVGGFGSSVAEIIAENTSEINNQIVFKRKGVKDTYIHEVGSHDFFLNINGLSKDKIKEDLREFAGNK
ncbi:MAG: transketolase C-terminal domain-containing protein [Nanoarchaeota archaeon]|nr:transketolase C-terminal domain-containing protein [Nanoarchaeota archaeon]